MKCLIFTLTYLVALVWLTLPDVQAQAIQPYRFEAEVGAGSLRLPTPYRSGYFVRQQLTGYVSPRLGVALGFGWGSSANLAPLSTSNPADPTTDPYEIQPDPAQLRYLYQRSEQMTDLSVVILPVLTRRHQVKIQVGLSAYRRQETRADSLIYLYPGRAPDYEIIPRQTKTTRYVPTVTAGYDVRLSNRWAVGLHGTAYFTGDARPTMTIGLRGTYRFRLLADSLGFAPIRWNELTWGVRAASTAVTENASPSRNYRVRFAGGLWAEVPLSLTWKLRGELTYAQRGYQTREEQQGNSRYLSAFSNVNYLELPLLFSHEAAYRWHVYTGPYLAFFLNGYSKTDGIRNPPPNPHTVSGLMFGTSYNLTDRLAADLRYQRDLITLSSSPYGGFHSFQLGLTYSFKKAP